MGQIILSAAISHTTIWVALGLVGLVGILALLSPKRFGALAQRGGQWVDTNKLAEVLDKRIDIDRYVLPFSRLLGVLVLLSVAVLAYLIAHYF